MTETPEYLSTSQAAAILGVSASTVVNLANEGTLECHVLVGRKHRRFLRSDVLGLIEKRRPQDAA